MLELNSSGSECLCPVRHRGDIKCFCCGGSECLCPVRSGVDLSGESQHAGCPQESSALPSSKGPKGALAGTNVLETFNV